MPAQCDNDDVHFVAMVSSTLTLLDRLRNRAAAHADALLEPPKTEALPAETLSLSLHQVLEFWTPAVDVQS